MKPRIDISDSNSHTIWESGRWNDEQGVGRSTVVSGQDGEKLSVIYDCDPSKSNFHFLFFANPGQVVANAFVRVQSMQDHYKYDLELLRIKSLTNEIVQGHSVPRAEYDTLWTLKTFGTSDYKALIDRSYNASRPGYKEIYRDLIVEAVRKALTPSANQKLFWGTPRVTARA